MAKIKGICKNYDGDCDLCHNKIVQEAERDNFVCEECGFELTEVTGVSKKKKFSKPIFVVIILAIIAIVGLSLCWLIPDKKIKVSEIKPAKTEYTLALGDSLAVSVDVLPEDATDKTLTWTSLNPEIVTVNNGVVKAISEGNTSLTVVADGGNAETSINIRVVAKPSENKDMQDTLSVISEPLDVEKNKVISDVNTAMEKSVTEKLRKNVGKDNNINNTSARTVKSNSSVATGAIFTGNTKNGMPHGQGRLIFKRSQRVDAHDDKNRTANRDDYIIGEWYNGHLVFGTLYNSNGTVLSSFNLGRPVSTDIFDPYYQADKSLYR